MGLTARVGSSPTIRTRQFQLSDTETSQIPAIREVFALPARDEAREMGDPFYDAWSKSFASTDFADDADEDPICVICEICGSIKNTTMFRFRTFVEDILKPRMTRMDGIYSCHSWFVFFVKMGAVRVSDGPGDPFYDASCCRYDSHDRYNGFPHELLLPALSLTLVSVAR